MKRTIKLPAEEIVKLDFTQQWQVTPFMTATLNEKSIEDVVWSEDGQTGTISYDTLDLEQPHTYNYITGEGVQAYVMEAGVHGRPAFYDAETMQEITDQELEDLLAGYDDWIVGETFVLDAQGNVPDIKRKYNHFLYKLRQVHTTQADWTPDITPALWYKIIPEATYVIWNVNDWASYQLGTKVSHNGVIYECVNPTYAWIEPGTQDGHFGWAVV